MFIWIVNIFYLNFIWDYIYFFRFRKRYVRDVKVYREGFFVNIYFFLFFSIVCKGRVLKYLMLIIILCLGVLKLLKDYVYNFLIFFLMINKILYIF